MGVGMLCVFIEFFHPLHKIFAAIFFLHLSSQGLCYMVSFVVMSLSGESFDGLERV